jgi:hypothetical protein
MPASACARPLLCLLPLLLYSCASEPDYAALQAEGAARQVPVLIYDTSWNNPRGWSNRAMDQAVAPGSVFVEILNTHPQQIAMISMYILACGTKGSVTAGARIFLQGPFEPGKSYKVAPQLTSMSGMGALQPWNQVNHMVFAEVKVQDSDGKTFDYAADVKQVLSANIANYCSNNI